MRKLLEGDDYLAQLTMLTGMTGQQWQDFLSCTPEQQMLIVQNYKDMDWVKNTSTLATVIAILGTLVSVASGVAGVAGCVSAIAALKSL